MEKEQKPIVDAMLRTSFRDVLSRSISILLRKRISECLNGIRIEVPTHVTPEQMAQIRRQCTQELLQDERFKKDAQLELDDISRMKSDLVAEILRQYALDKNLSESTHYHDTLCTIFDQCLWNIRVSVNKGRWKDLGF